MSCRTYWLAATLLAAAAGTATTAPARAKPLVVQQQITSAANSKCLGTAGSPRVPAAVVFPCTGHPDQVWTMRNDGSLENNNSQCLGVKWGIVKSGAELVGFRCDGTPNQRWVFNPSAAGRGIFVNGADRGQCMTAILGPEKLNRLVLSDCTGEAAQQWSVPQERTG